VAKREGEREGRRKRGVGKGRGKEKMTEREAGRPRRGQAKERRGLEELTL
jgi:hypothetical protein